MTKANDDPGSTELTELVAGSSGSGGSRRLLQALVRKHQQLGTTGLVAKLREYPGRGGRVGDLIAELQMAAALAVHLDRPPVLQTDNAADLRFELDNGVQLTVEVQHKSSVSAFDSIFYPDVDLLPAYADHVGWRGAAWRLHQALRTRAIEVSPWVEAGAVEPEWAGADRAAKELLCANLADWLVDQLPGTVDGPVSLRHELVRFDLAPLASPPGRISGTGALDAFFVRQYDSVEEERTSLARWLSDGVTRKARTAMKFPERRGDFHLVGLVVDDVWGADGAALAGAFYGGLHAEQQEDGTFRPFRAVPDDALSRYSDAVSRGRGALMDHIGLETGQRSAIGEGLIFSEEDVAHGIEGVVALNYMSCIQFFPNPLTPRDLAALLRFMPEPLQQVGPLDLYVFPVPLSS